VLRHSFYFYFYFEHLNFTWSYLIDMKISWSLDHIFWSYLDDLISAILSLDLLIISLNHISWSTILSDLLILSSDDDPRYVSLYELYIITYMHSTCLWLMSFIDDRHTFCYNFNRFSLYRRDRIQSVSDNAQASVQGASWAHVKCKVKACCTATCVECMSIVNERHESKACQMHVSNNV